MTIDDDASAYDTWNDDIIEDTKSIDMSSVVVYSRDWTVETVANQISAGNIDLNPKFQRRNAWTDARRSMLIESLILGVPVPEIVLAEDPARKKAFIVIDGKQRLLSLAGYISPAYLYWNNAVLAALKNRDDLNGVAYEALKNDPAYSGDFRSLMNADVRCTVISNYKSIDVLYDIFYRLNTSSVALSTQELRQVLHRGPFADYLIEATKTVSALHRVLNLNQPDARLRDAEILLRFIAVNLLPETYEGNLKKFLDDAMETIKGEWATREAQVIEITAEFMRAVDRLSGILEPNRVGRKYVNSRWETRFNKVLFEVQAFYFRYIPDSAFSDAANQEFVRQFQALCSGDTTFRDAIESTTKTPDKYHIRFEAIRSLVNRVYSTSIATVPISPRPANG